MVIIIIIIIIIKIVIIIIINNNDNKQMVFVGVYVRLQATPRVSLKISRCWVYASRWDSEQLTVTDPG